MRRYGVELSLGTVAKGPEQAESNRVRQMTKRNGLHAGGVKAGTAKQTLL